MFQPLDLIKLVEASSKFSIISKYTTTSKFSVEAKNRYLQYVNSNRLVEAPHGVLIYQKLVILEKQVDVWL